MDAQEKHIQLQLVLAALRAMPPDVFERARRDILDIINEPTQKPEPCTCRTGQVRCTGREHMIRAMHGEVERILRTGRKR